MGNANSYRLPTNVNPVNYELSLSPDLENFTFHGEEAILITVTEETKSLSLFTFACTNKRVLRHDEG